MILFFDNPALSRRLRVNDSAQISDSPAIKQLGKWSKTFEIDRNLDLDRIMSIHERSCLDSCASSCIGVYASVLRMDLDRGLPSRPK